MSLFPIVVVLAVLLYLIIRRIQIKQNETFEDREN